jgi:hypothetical protein
MKASRHEFVDRNNDIVLAYRERVVKAEMEEEKTSEKPPPIPEDRIVVTVAPFDGGRSIATARLEAYDENGNLLTADEVTWKITGNTTANSAVITSFQSSLYGLNFDNKGLIVPSTPSVVDTGDWSFLDEASYPASGTVELWDYIGERTVTIEATYRQKTLAANITFGNGPLSDFKLPNPSAVTAYAYGNDLVASNVTVWNAAEACGGRVEAGWFSFVEAPLHVNDIRIPALSTMRNILSTDVVSGIGLVQLAGWPRGSPALYWTGELDSGGSNAIVLQGYSSYSHNSGYLTMSCYLICMR